jgi:hypothetical protein
MAGRGPAPKTTASRQRDLAKREAQIVVITPDDELRGPDLPAHMTWPSQTAAWWLTWRKSPLAKTFTTTDWDFLLDTALLHAELWSGNGSVAAELRLRVAKFGATPEDRLRLRLTIDQDAEASQAKPATVMTRQRKQRLLKVVNDTAV